MGDIHVKLSDDLEFRLRKAALKKGDISKIVEEALRKHLKEEGEQK